MKCLNKNNLLMFTNKLIKNIPDPCSAKGHCESFIMKESRKSVKLSEIITYQPRTFQNQDIVDVKLIIIIK